MIEIQCINAIQLDGDYNRNELIKILTSRFDSSNPIFTQFSNSKEFQINLKDNNFRIKKIDKLVDSSDPLYMALTQINGVLEPDGSNVRIKLCVEIHLIWVITLVFLFLTGIVTTLIFSIEFVSIIPISVLMYFTFRHFAKQDFKIFIPYFKNEIIKAKIK